LAQEEIFGPILALIKVESFEEGLAVANNTEYGLTGSLYSTSREKLDRARREFHVGNLYFKPQVYGRHGRRASVWRIQHERDGLQGGRSGLSVLVYAGQERLPRNCPWRQVRDGREGCDRSAQPKGQGSGKSLSDGAGGGLPFGIETIAHFGGSLGEHAVMNGEERQFKPVADTGFIVDRAKIVLDHLLGGVQADGNFAVLAGLAR